MSVLVALGFLTAHFYYQWLNNSVDPRVVEARKLYGKYNELATGKDYDKLFDLLNKIESIYGSWSHYRNSFEVGVMKSDKAAALLNLVMYKDSIVYKSTDYGHLSADSLLTLAEAEVRFSMSIYENWMTKYEGRSEDEISEMIDEDFWEGLEAYPERKKRRYKKTRIREIIDARVEHPRRLSVSYNNLGLIHRNRKNYEDAKLCYEKAMELWADNLDALNNYKVLKNEKKVKRNPIQKLFPRKKGT